MTTFTSCTVACFGRGLVKNNGEYALTAESARRAWEVGQFWQSNFRPKIKSIVSTGGWPALWSGMEEPPADKREGIFMKALMVKEGVPSEKIKVESKSPYTFAQFYNCIQAGFFHYGAYNSQHRFVWSVSNTNLWRNALLARRILGVLFDDQLRLRPGNSPKENSPEAQKAEYGKTLLTLYVADQVEQKLRFVPHDDESALQYIQALDSCWRELWPKYDSGELDVRAYFAGSGYTWPLCEIPILTY